VTSVKLEIEQQEKEGILILELKGRLVLGPEDLELRQKLQVILDGGNHNCHSEPEGSFRH